MENYMITITEDYVNEQKKICEEMRKLIAESNKLLSDIRLGILVREEHQLRDKMNELAV